MPEVSSVVGTGLDLGTPAAAGVTVAAFALAIAADAEQAWAA